MKSVEISDRAFRFFEQRGHTAVPTSSLIADDPTLLLINAGMVPFKPYFLEERTPPYDRACSLQKCVRTVDIEEVGKTSRHGSFFQMFGNFSFGDYFKESAIPYAWEFLTASLSDGGLGLPESKLWVTIYEHDDEADDIWRNKVGVPAERIQRLGMAENFWSMGVPGPCGPASEICYDRGPEFGPEGGPAVDGERYLEIWNLVFMQNLRGEGPAKEDYPIVGELPAKNIDTGLGLERVAALLQDAPTIFDIDTTRQVLDLAAELTGTSYGAAREDDVSLRVIADHLVSSVMLIGDGVTPSNEGRGYILRRLLRRAIRTMRTLGAREAVAYELVDRTVEVMSPTYPGLADEHSRIDQVAVGEEATFLQTLKSGTAMFDLAARDARSSGDLVLPGDRAFQLHDTYGFPIDLTLEMAQEQGLSVDENEFQRLMSEQRERAKADAKAKKQGHTDLSAYREIAGRAGETTFTGYTDHESESRVLGLLVNGKSVAAAGAGDRVELMLDRSPFYAESGGQLADKGTVSIDGRGVVDVEDVQKPVAGLSVHYGTVRSGEIAIDDQVRASIDTARRGSVSRSHSATHLVHAALRSALGSSTRQAGSENQPGRLRFDFTASNSLSDQELGEVEDEVNDVLTGNIEVVDFETSLDDALSMGALAMFSQKYGDRVRVIEMSDYSRELCGGTHVRATGQLGMVKLLGESSIGSGVRRVEAAVGMDAFRQTSKESMLLSQLSEQMKTSQEELPDRIESTLTRLNEAEKEVSHLRAAQLKRLVAQFVDSATDMRGVSVISEHLSEPANADELRRFVLDIRDRLGDRPTAVTVTALSDDKPIVASAVSERAREHGLAAGELVGAAATALNGGGGGKPDIAQGGGTDPLSTPDALRVVTREIARVLGP